LYTFDNKLYTYFSDKWQSCLKTEDPSVLEG
jgi:hypothetical protein